MTKPAPPISVPLRVLVSLLPILLVGFDDNNTHLTAYLTCY